MRFLVISDIHGSYPDLYKAFSFLSTLSIDRIIICGDYLNHGPRNAIPTGYDTKKTANLLNQYKACILGIRGNCDSEVDQMMLEFYMSDEITRVFISSNSSKTDNTILVHHGHKFSKEYIMQICEPGAVIVSGHTHIPEITIENGYCFLNPGSISIPKNKTQDKTFAVVEVDTLGISKISIYKLDGSEIKSLEYKKSCI